MGDPLFISAKKRKKRNGKNQYQLALIYNVIIEKKIKIFSGFAKPSSIKWWWQYQNLQNKSQSLELELLVMRPFITNKSEAHTPVQ